MTVVGIKTAPLLTYRDDEDRDISNTPVSTSEGFLAQAGNSFSSSFGPLAVRALQRASVDDGVEMTAEQANDRYAIGNLKFTEPVEESSAAQYYATEKARLRRDDMVRRSELGGFGRVVASFAGAAVDPANIAAAVFPETLLARFGVGGGVAADAALTRGAAIAARARYGAAEGALGQLPLSAGSYALSKQEGQPYTLGDAFTDVVFGTALGAGLHAGIGAFIDWRTTGKPMSTIEQSLQNASTADRQNMLRGAVANVMEGRPVGVAPMVDKAVQNYADTEFNRILWSSDKLSKEDTASLARYQQTADAANRGAPMTDRIGELEQDLQQLRTERGAATDRQTDLEGRVEAADPDADAFTAQRLKEVDYELNWPQGIPAARRADLEAEKTMLTAGAGPSPEDLNLEALRAGAESRGLAVAETRTAGQLDVAQAARDRADTAIGNARAAYEEATGLTASKRAVAQTLAERTLRGYAGRLGIGVAPDDIEAAARRIISTPAPLAKQRVAFELDQINQLRAVPANRAGSPGLEAVARSQLEPHYDPEDLAASEAVGSSVAAAPPLKARSAEEGIGGATPDLRELEALDAQAAQGLAALKAQGVLSAADEEALAAADEGLKEAQKLSKVRDMAATCLAGGF